MKKKFKLTKDSLARMCANAGILPAHSESYKGYGIVIGDGRVVNPAVVLKRFGIERDDFPFGCYCTLWGITKDDDVFIAGVLPNSLSHDASHDANSRRMARISGGVMVAKMHIDKLRKAAAKRLH